MELPLNHLVNELNLPLRVIYCIQYIKDNNICKEQVKEDFKFIRYIERTYTKLFKDYVASGKIKLSNTTNYYSIKDYKKKGEVGTIMAIKYLINMLKYEYNITKLDLDKYSSLIKKYFNHNYRIKLWFEYNKYNIYKYSEYYIEWEYYHPNKEYIYYTDKKYYKIIKNIMGY